jgi:hypothetical protein
MKHFRRVQRLMTMQKRNKVLMKNKNFRRRYSISGASSISIKDSKDKGPFISKLESSALVP